MLNARGRQTLRFGTWAAWRMHRLVALERGILAELATVRITLMTLYPEERCDGL